MVLFKKTSKNSNRKRTTANVRLNCGGIKPLVLTVAAGVASSKVGGALLKIASTLVSICIEGAARSRYKMADGTHRAASIVGVLWW